MQRAKQPSVLSERFGLTFSEMKVKPKILRCRKLVLSLPRTRRRSPLTKREQNSIPFVVAEGEEKKGKKGILSWIIRRIMCFFRKWLTILWSYLPYTQPPTQITRCNWKQLGPPSISELESRTPRQRRCSLACTLLKGDPPPRPLPLNLPVSLSATAAPHPLDAEHVQP